MKRYANNSKNVIDVVKLIDKISTIYVTTDANMIYASSDLDPDEMDDAYYLSWTDEQLSSLSKEEVHVIQHPEVISRIHRLDSSKLSKDQLKYLQQTFRKKYKMGEQQKKNLLDMLVACKDIKVQNFRTKNLMFTKTHAITDDDIHYILQQLTTDDFDCKTQSINAQYSGDLLVVLKPKTIKLLDGTTLPIKSMYIKIDVSILPDDPYAIISFHN